MATAPRGPRSLLGRWDAMRGDPSLRREADMMAFYLGVTLLVALNVPQDGDPPPLPELLLIIWGTTVGLALAHWFALGLSVEIVHDPALHHTPGEMLLSQVVMGVALAVVASVAVLVTPTAWELRGARVAVSVFVAALVVLESRVEGRPVRQALALGAVALGLTLAVATVKSVLGLK
ncbi:MAG TPA: hypothetical protein VES95_13440 [Dermatophilaceae bacterium]|nr:hypothetical protein [Dermatophilaceae bacterium]